MTTYRWSGSQEDGTRVSLLLDGDSDDYFGRDALQAQAAKMEEEAGVTFIMSENLSDHITVPEHAKGRIMPSSELYELVPALDVQRRRRARSPKQRRA
jgi:hypothetical protein